MSAEPKIRAAGATGLLALVMAAGVDAHALAIEAGIAPSKLADPDAPVLLRSFVAMFELAAKRVGDPLLGLRIGLSQTPAELGVLGYVLVHAPTIGGAIDNLRRYMAAHQEGAELRIEQATDATRVSYRIMDPTIQPRRQDAELTIGLGLALLRSLVAPDYRPREVWFEHPPPAGDVATHRELIGCPVHFGRETNAVIMDAAVLARPTPRPDAALLSILERHAQDILRERHAATSLRAQVRAAIAERLRDGAPPITDIAHDLAMSEPTLRRRLAEEGGTFTGELDEARRALGERYLRDPALTLTEIAFLLGYSDGTAFHRAFKRLTGHTPRAFRRNLRAS